jgi:hypothetical protein
MNYTSLFYWLVVADNARLLFGWGAGIFTGIAALSTAFNLFARGGSINSDNSKTEQDEYAHTADVARKWMWWSYPFMFFWWSCLVFTPTKRDALLIVAGGQTLNFLANDKSAKQIPAELSNFVLTEIKNQAREASVDLNIADQKDKLLEKAKKMSAEELMNEMKKDTTFAKVILDK